EDTLENVVRAAKLKVQRRNGEWTVMYYERSFPLAPESVASFRTTDAALSTEELLALLAAQHYRFAHWRDAAHAINYRRFFDVSELVSLRMDRPEVFHATHRRVFELIRAGKVTGLRVDHPDGLLDPRVYFERLQEPFAAHNDDERQLYVVAEKILSSGESLRGGWPIAGTTGYEFLNDVNALFVESA